MSDALPEAPAEGRDWFGARFDVSRETMAKLDRYAELLGDWQAKYNLVGPATLPYVWTRHFADSAQIADLPRKVAHRPRWLDIGSGGGFPGLVVALLTGDSVTLVDSVRKKTAFLEAVRDEIGLTSTVVIQTARVESLDSPKFDIVTARACAPIVKLFDWAGNSAAKSATWLLLKGAAADDEIAEAKRRFDFDYECIASLTDPRGRIVRATNVRGKRRR